jgi:hypothetical protein
VQDAHEGILAGCGPGRNRPRTICVGYNVTYVLFSFAQPTP